MKNPFSNKNSNYKNKEDKKKNGKLDGWTFVNNGNLFKK
jgi:hypothetical protein